MTRRPDLFAHFDETKLTTKAERKILVESFERAIQAAEDILENGCQKAMNDYN